MNTLKNVGKRVVALVLALMMCVGMLATTAFAEAPEGKPHLICKETVHTHEDSCYNMVCEIEEHTHNREECDWHYTCTDTHEHTNACWKTETGTTVNCGYEDHTHTVEQGCYGECTKAEHNHYADGCSVVWTCDHVIKTDLHALRCDQWKWSCGAGKDDPGHSHGDGTCTYSSTPVCTKHVHTPACYESRVLDCNNPAHQGEHVDGCAWEYTCNTDVHTHGDGTCNLVRSGDAKCGKDEHTHGDACYSGHVFENYTQTKAATCLANAEETGTCKYCDATDTREIANSKLPHVYEGATCKTLGTCKNGCGQKGGELNPANHEGLSRLAWNDSEHMKVYECCNAVDESTRFAHDFTWEKVGDTYFGYCNGCLYERTDVVLPEHTCKFDGDWVVGNGYHWHNCTVYPGDCPGVQDKDEHSTTQGWVDNSDGTHKKVCDVCGATYETADHNWNAWVKVEDGYQRTCAGCGAVDTDTSKVTVDDGHDHTAYAVGVDAVAATCTETGLTAGVKCDLCDEWITEPTVTDALNHDFGDWYTVTAAQVGVAGLERHDCRREGCGASETRRIDPLPDTGTGDVVIDDTNPPLGGDPDGGEVELDDGEIPLAGPVTRAEFVDYLYRHEGSPDTALSTFVDVPADHDYANAVGWGQANNIAWGISETEFAPDELVTVEQVKLFLSRYAAFKGSEMPELAALVGLDDQDPAMNCDEILGEFFGADE